MIIALHHPEYLPQISWFGRILLVDKMILLDDIPNADRNSESFITHGQIRGSQGPLRLTVPILRHPRHTPLNSVLINATATHWAAKHARSVAMSYGHMQGWHDDEEELVSLYARNWTKLIDLNMAFIEYQMRKLLLPPARLILSSEIRHEVRSNKPSDLVEYFGATEYMAGPAELHRLSVEEKTKIASQGARLTRHEWQSPEYDQPYKPFLPNLAALDLILSAGARASDLLHSAQQCRRPAELRLA